MWRLMHMLLMNVMQLGRFNPLSILTHSFALKDIKNSLSNLRPAFGRRVESGHSSVK